MQVAALMGTALTLLGATASVMSPASLGLLDNGETPLEAVAGPDVTVEPGEEVAFDATGSTGEGDLQYLWFFGDGGAEPGGLPSYATEPVTAFTYATEGVYEALLLVVEEDGTSDWDTRVIAVGNVLPDPVVAVDGEAAGELLEVQEDQVVAFSGALSEDTEPLTYRWTFGDGETAEGAEAEHAYAREGMYVARLEVEDSHGARDRDFVIVSVENVAPTAAATFPEEAGEDETVVFDASASTDTPSDVETLAYIWSLGGAFAVGPVVEHAFATAGAHDVLLAVVDDNAAVSFVEGSIEILNAAPTAAAEVVLTAREGGTTLFDASASGDTPSDAPLLGHAWDVDADGEADREGARTTYVFPDDSVHPVELRVTDDDGAEALLLQEVEVLNVAPTPGVVDVSRVVTVNLTVAGTPGHQVDVALFEEGELMASGSVVREPGDPKDQALEFESLEFPLGRGYAALLEYVPLEGEVGSNPAWLNLSFEDGSRRRLHHTFNIQHEDTYVWEVDLDPHLTTVRLVGAVYEPGADDLVLRWDFGDGTGAEAVRTATAVPGRFVSEVFHTFPLGTFEAAFHATDDDGGTGSDVFVVHAGEDAFTLDNLRPRAFLDEVMEAWEDEEVLFTAEALDPDGEVASYHWDFRDGGTAEGREAAHAFSEAGSYHVLLTVMDDDGETTVDSVEVRVANPAPAASVTVHGDPVEEMLLEFHADATDNPSDLASLRHRWTFGDGGVGTGPEVVHAYDQAGSYLVTLTARDDNGATAEATVEVVVENLPPVAGFEGPEEALVEEPVLFTSTSLDTPIDASVLHLLWTVDGDEERGSSLLHTFFEPGVYEVELAATDMDGVADEAVGEVEVANRAPEAHIPFETLRVYAHGGTVSLRGLGFDTLLDELFLAFAWDFGDGAVGEGSEVVHTYAATGVYDVTLEVTDPHGAVGVDAASVIVILDADGDGLPDDYEEVLGTDPTNPDSDGDGVWDSVEILLLETHPLLPPEE